MTNHHPQEKRMMVRLRNKEAKKVTARKNETSGVNGILNQVFYNSGRLVAKIGQLTKGPEPKRSIKRVVRKARKG